MRRAFLLVTCLTLASCGPPDRIAEDADNLAALPEPIDNSSLSPAGGPPANDTASAAADAPAPEAGSVSIPAALHGRWGLSPADCMASLGNAKGLLVINANRLRFYESVAVPAANVLTSDDTIGGTFAFTGEGQTWARYQNLQVKDGELVRTERDPVASFRYVRC